jgi:hypothetical protein
MNTIILTGAIDPSWPVTRNNPLVRLTDYLCAIRRWLEVPLLDQVIYCDAGGCTIPENVFGYEKFESLSFDASDHARQYEAGRAEAETIQYVLEKSRFSFDSFYKCTGRLCIENFTELFHEMERKQDIPLFLRPWYAAGWADTRFFRITVKAFKQWIEPRIQELTGQKRHGHVIESLFHEYLNRAVSFSEPYFIGHDGHQNRLYGEDFSEQEQRTASQIISRWGIAQFVPDVSKNN